MAVEKYFDNEGREIGLASTFDSGSKKENMESEIHLGKDGEVIGSVERFSNKQELIEELGRLELEIISESDPEKKSEMESRKAEIENKIESLEGATREV